MFVLIVEVGFWYYWISLSAIEIFYQSDISFFNVTSCIRFYCSPIKCVRAQVRCNFIMIKSFLGFKNFKLVDIKLHIAWDTNDCYNHTLRFLAIINDFNWVHYCLSNFHVRIVLWQSLVYLNFSFWRAYRINILVCNV